MMSKNNKTCGGCRYYVSGRHGGVCTLISCEMCSDDDVCNHFEKPTLGDKIRRMSNEEIAAFVCGVLNDRREETFRSVLDLLNAPAESKEKNEL